MTPGEMAGRVEAAEGPSREMDADVLVAAGILTPHEDRRFPGTLFKRDNGFVVSLLRGWEIGPDGSPLHGVEPVTASLDAAVAFVERVLPGWRHGYQQEIDRSFFATLKRPRTGQWTGGQVNGQAATPAMALVAAALRALQDAQDGAK